mmetsp:Transcript_15828/g.24748  ORF Transcript_15828/g.24748 Transcript_15828/m.24748 type:complete len:101 (+) Transcript_15828:7-309(+)
MGCLSKACGYVGAGFLFIILWFFTCIECYKNRGCCKCKEGEIPEEDTYECCPCFHCLGMCCCCIGCVCSVIINDKDKCDCGTHIWLTAGLLYHLQICLVL